jgi:hypothetical protein
MCLCTTGERMDADSLFDEDAFEFGEEDMKEDPDWAHSGPRSTHCAAIKCCSPEHHLEHCLPFASHRLA